MITLKRFKRLEDALTEAGHALDRDWSEGLQAPRNADEFAEAAINVIANSGMSYLVGSQIHTRCLAMLKAGRRVRRAFRHPGKARAIEHIWAKRERLFREFLASEDKLAFCEGLPWVGPTTRYHLAKDLGVDVAKPDVHLARLAIGDRTTVARMCAKLARQTGYRIATIDTILWRACATGILDSKAYQLAGWCAAYRGKPRIKH